MRSLDRNEDFAIRLVRRFLLLCEHPQTRSMVMRMVRQSTKEGPDAPRLYRWINRAVLHPALAKRGLPDSALKVELVASQLVGLAMVRYVLEVEPMASASVEEVVHLTAPVVSAVLAGNDAYSPAAMGITKRRTRGARAVRRTASRARGRV